MPKDLVIVVASSNDVAKERDLVEKEIARINRGLAKKLDVRFEVRRWEEEAYPAQHEDGPQGICDSVLDIPNCAIVVGILWSRLGEGTRHELESARDGWKMNKRPKLMLYVSDAPPPSYEEKDLLSMAAVKKYRDEREKDGLVWRYPDVHGFQAELGKTLENLLDSHEGRELIGAVDETGGGAVPKFIRTYRARLGHFAELWDSRNLGARLGFAEHAKEIHLEDIFQQVRLSADPASDEGLPLEPDELMRRDRPLLIRGPAGAGKTTWMKRTFDRLIRNEAALPLFVELRAVAKDWRENGEGPFDAALERCVARECSADGLREYLQGKQGPRPILLVDGWDELGTRGKTMRAKLLGFLKEHPRVLAVVTSRPYGQGQPSENAGFEALDLQPLNNEEITLFAERFYRICFGDETLAEPFLEALKGSKGAQRLAGTPVLLTMMLGLSRFQQLPEDRHKLYEACIKVLLARTKMASQQGAEILEDDLPSEDERLRLAAEIAYGLQSSSDEWDGPIVADLRTMLGFVRAHWDDQRKIAFLEWLAGPAALLNARADGTYAFTHLSFQEFLAAWNRQTALKTEQERTDFVREKAEMHGWWETLQLWVALLEGREGKSAVESSLEPLLESDSPRSLAILSDLLANGTGTDSIFRRWAPQFARAVALNSSREIRRASRNWIPSGQIHRKRQMCELWGPIAAENNWNRWLHLLVWLEDAEYRAQLPLPQKGAPIAQALYTQQGNRCSVAFGRVLVGGAPTWPGTPSDVALLNAWPARRTLVGVSTQSGVSFGLAPESASLTAFKSHPSLGIEAIVRAARIASELLPNRSRPSMGDSSGWEINSAIDLSYPMSNGLLLSKEIFEEWSRFWSIAPRWEWERTHAIRWAGELSYLWYSAAVHQARSLARTLDLGADDPDVVDFLSWELASFGRYSARARIASFARDYLNPYQALIAQACWLSYGHNAPPLPRAPHNTDPLWPALARHIARQSTPEDRELLEDLARHPEKREPPLSWGLQFIVRGDVMLEDGSVVTLDELCDQHGLPHLPYLEDMPPELDIDWDEGSEKE